MWWPPVLIAVLGSIAMVVLLVILYRLELTLHHPHRPW